MRSNKTYCYKRFSTINAFEWSKRYVKGLKSSTKIYWKRVIISSLSSALYCIRKSVFFKRAETTFEDKTKLFRAYRKLISYDWIQQETKKFILKPDLKWHGNSWHELLVEKCSKYIKWKGISTAKENVHSSFVDTTEELQAQLKWHEWQVSCLKDIRYVNIFYISIYEILFCKPVVFIWSTHLRL